MDRPRVRIVSPALAQANNGNWHTAARWQGFLAADADIDIALDWDGTPVDALIALHARRSAESVERYRAAHPRRALALVLTGTDLYRDLERDAAARHALQCASHVVVLQPQALRRLDAATGAKARVILQSATAPPPADAAEAAASGATFVASGACAFVAVGHLRDEKDPATLMAAARLLPAGPGIVHIGRALDPAFADAARRTMADSPHYRWLGGLPQAEARRWIARSCALVHMSRIEGGANVVIEALVSGVAVLASRIDGNVGLLGDDYAGYFPPGDAEALARLMRRFAAEPGFAAALAAHCATLAPRHAPAAERAAVRGLLADLLAYRAA